MDVAYNPHAERSRRKNRSSTNVNHLSLAPLTSKMPLRDAEALPDNAVSVPSYITGKSAPTTPRFISHTPATPRTPRSRSHHRTPSAPDTSMTKSKSYSHLAHGKSRSGASTPRRRRDDALQAARNANDGDWMLRTGVVVSTEAREFKGQQWLVSRQSSTSLAAMRNPDDDPYEQELIRERDARRGSSAFADDDTSPVDSRRPSRFASRAQSIAERERSSALQTPSHYGGDSYFPEAISGPDFVNLDEKLEELERDTDKDDEAAIRKLVRDGQTGKGSWLTNMISFNIFNVDEDESDEDSEDDEEAEQTRAGMQTPRVGDGITMLPATEVPPPSKKEGAWNDAAWLLSVASKVMF